MRLSLTRCLVASATLAFATSACSGGGATPTSVATPAGSQPVSSSSAAPGSNEAQGLDAICAAGASEGSLQYWAQLEATNFEKIKSAFESAQPGITVELLPIEASESTQRIITESGAGRNTADVTVGTLADLQPLQERDLLDTSVDWPAAGVAENLVTPENSVRVYRVPLGLVFNTGATTPDAIPDTWDAVIDPKWDGKFITDPRGNVEPYFALAWGKERTLEYVRKASELHPILVEGGTAGMLAVAAGQAPFTLYGRADSNLEQRAKGAPIDIKYLDIIPTTDFYNAVVVGAPHPNAAACFVGWLASPDGAKVYSEVEFKTNDDLPPGAPQGAEVVFIKNADDAALFNAVATETARIYTGG